MCNFNKLVDILSSVASLIAIATVLCSWWLNQRPPVKISQFISSPHRGQIRIFLRLINRKGYPIKILSLTCYKKQTFSISKKKGMKPQIHRFLNISNKLFHLKEEFELSEFGELNKEIFIENQKFSANDLRYELYTSHGFISLKCKNNYIFDKETETYFDNEVLQKEHPFSAYSLFGAKYAVYLFEKIMRIK
jgi:hypothetical protein